MNTTPATQHDIQEIKKDVEKVGSKVDEVHRALMGSPLSRDGGIIKRLMDCENQLEEIDKMISTIEKNNMKSNFYIHVIWACGGALLIALTQLVLNHFFKST